MTKFLPFYSEGLKFTCTRCSDCCRHETGYVFLSKSDLSRLALEFSLTPDQFISQYCRWTPSISDSEKLSLAEKPNLDCIFWDSGCSVYKSRPLQCRTYPFWPNIVNNKRAWERMSVHCPGINNGELHGSQEIEKILQSQETEITITRNISARGA